MVAGALTWLDDHFAQPWLLVMLGLLPTMILLGVVISRRRRLAARAVAGPRFPADSMEGWRRFRWACVLLGMTLLVLGAAGPRWGRDPHAPRPLGRDLLVVLDISRSMLAEDNGPPNRLEHAKTELFNLVDQIQRRGGHRLGLIGFAGQAHVLCPLTEDLDHFRNSLDLAHPDRLGAAERIGRGAHDPGYGTSLRHALELALTSHDPEGQGFQDILLVSDGEDLAGDWRDALPGLQKANLAVQVFGVGDAKKDSFIPTGRSDRPFLLQEAGAGYRKVTTRRRDEVLQAIAEETHGGFLPEGHSLSEWFPEQLAGKQVRERSADQRPVLVHRYAYFFGATFALFLLELFLSSRRRL
jgi:Ca-activated chloride channel family protein